MTDINITSVSVTETWSPIWVRDDGFQTDGEVMFQVDGGPEMTETIWVNRETDERENLTPEGEAALAAWDAHLKGRGA